MYIDRIALWCAPLNANGTLGTARSVGSQGGSGGERAFSVKCPVGHVIKGIMGNVGSGLAPFVHSIGIYCRNWEGSQWGGTGNLWGPEGGSGGSFTKAECTAREQPVVGLHGRFGMFIDAVGVVCDEVARPTSTVGRDGRPLS